MLNRESQSQIVVLLDMRNGAHVEKRHVTLLRFVLIPALLEVTQNLVRHDDFVITHVSKMSRRVLLEADDYHLHGAALPFMLLL